MSNDGNKQPEPVVTDYQNKQKDVVNTVSQGVQILLKLKYKEILQQGLPLPEWDDVQFRAYSRNSEDGLLLFIFSIIGATNKEFVEICAGSGYENNTANLVINHGWHGLMVDGDEKLIESGKKYYRECPDTRRIFPPKLVHAWITKDSVNELITSNGFQGEIDLFSLDIDGNDYWIWDSIDCIDPRVVILEYANAWGADHAVTQKYQADFVWKPKATPLGLCGASLPAFVKLGRSKGYRLVCVNNRCNNAIFIRNGIADDLFPEIPAEQCFTTRMAQFNIERRSEHEKTASLMDDWVEV